MREPDPENRLVEGRVTKSISGGFYASYNYLGYGSLESVSQAELQLLNYLRATNLEVGLLFHFSPKPKFYRVFHRRVDANPPAPSDLTDPKIIY